MKTAGVKDVKNRLSHYLREVKKGEKILVTERNQAIAAIVPVDRAGEDARLMAFVKEGFASWQGGKPIGSAKPAIVKGKTVSEIILDGRR